MIMDSRVACGQNMDYIDGNKRENHLHALWNHQPTHSVGCLRSDVSRGTCVVSNTHIIW